jgi:hypothetical protein
LLTQDLVGKVLEERAPNAALGHAQALCRSGETDQRWPAFGMAQEAPDALPWMSSENGRGFRACHDQLVRPDLAHVAVDEASCSDP